MARRSAKAPAADTSADLMIRSDPYLTPYAHILKRRLHQVDETEQRLTQGKRSLADFAGGHEFFGLHRRGTQWIFREWAPNATALYLIGDFSHWRTGNAFRLAKIDTDGVWEVRLPAASLAHGDLYRLRMIWPGGEGDRIPAWTRRVVQDPRTNIFNAQVWQPDRPYQWQCADYEPAEEPPLIYEAHIGMAQTEPRVGTFAEFTANVLPRIVAAGYNTVQLMAVPEHPYYGSFGYHVSSFFAVSSRFGTPEEFMALVDAAHAQGLRVLIDLVHSHAVNNEVEGLSRFDGTLYQYFHDGARGRHAAWDSRCFDYGKVQVLHFLLSNCRYWLDAYKVDGFRFDGITSMLYHHHGLGKPFTSYDDYFNDQVDEQALTYLTLANKLIHAVKPAAVTIAEDISGMPGLAAPITQGGTGFDYRFAMGVPDYWIKLTKDVADEDWSMDGLWYELNNRRQDEKTISYAESHDQALVGDQALIFRLIGTDMYTHMRVDDPHMRVDRGMALHKLIRLITLATADKGYLNFMGNEFGHPEWVDFPRQGNNWSYHYARRQWPLADDPALKFQFLARFDRDMLALVRAHALLRDSRIERLHLHNDDKVIIFERAGLIMAFNFHPTKSFTDYPFDAPPGKYRMIFNSDASTYGGHNRLAADQVHLTQYHAQRPYARHTLNLYLPARTALVLQPE